MPDDTQNGQEPNAQRSGTDGGNAGGDGGQRQGQAPPDTGRQQQDGQGGGSDDDRLAGMSTEQLQDEVRRLRGESAGYRNKRRTVTEERDEALARIRELEQAQMSEAERDRANRQSAERDRDEARLELARFKVATRKGLTESQAGRLRGSTEDELMEDADALLREFGGQRQGGDGDGGSGDGRGGDGGQGDGYRDVGQGRGTGGDGQGQSFDQRLRREFARR